MTFLESKVLKVWSILFCIRKYGWRNAILMNVLVGSTSGERHLRFASEGGIVPFTFRGKLDLGVLSHFTKEGYRIEDSEAGRVETILDAGANIGDETARFRIHHPGAEIIAVEADPENFAILERNCAGCEKVSAVLGAVWDRDGELTLQRESGSPETSAVGEGQGGTRVRAYSILALMRMRKWDRIDVLKLDIEGAEHQLFSGDTAWLDKVNALIFEIPDAERAGTTQLIFEKLAGETWNGFACGENLVMIRDGLPWKAQRGMGVA